MRVKKVSRGKKMRVLDMTTFWMMETERNILMENIFYLHFSLTYFQLSYGVLFEINDHCQD